MRTVTISLGWDKEQLIEMNTKPFEAKKVSRIKLLKLVEREDNI